MSIKCAVQILLDLKGADPTALSAREAIQNLLGFGDRLRDLRRRELHELAVESGLGSQEPGEAPGVFPLGPLEERIARYLERTVRFWNPNKQRAWVRITTASGEETPAWEAVPGGTRRPGAFGSPPLSERRYDHILVWSRGLEAPPDELVAALLPAALRGYRKGELYSLLWREEASREERRAWTLAVSVVKSRKEGFLVNPHFQDHRILPGEVPAMGWAGA